MIFTTRFKTTALLALAALMTPLTLLAQDGIDQRINDAVKPFSDAVAGFIFSSFPLNGIQMPFVLVWLIVAATIFTLYFRFINLRALRHGL